MRKFTFVELIVTMTAVIFLGTISLVSYVGYTSTSRDFLRTREIAQIEASLEIYKSRYKSYPTPTESININYLGGKVWEQGTIGRSVLNALDRMTGTPKDPLFGTEYVYSVTSSKGEYEISSIMEEDGVEFNKFMPRNIIPGVKRGDAYVTGTYNGFLSKVDAQDTSYILAVPSIIVNDLKYRDVRRITDEQRYVYNGYKNLAHNLVDHRINTNGGFNFSPGRLVVYTGDVNELMDDTNRKEFLNQAQLIYKGTIIQNDEVLTEFINSQRLLKVLGIELLESNE